MPTDPVERQPECEPAAYITYTQGMSGASLNWTPSPGYLNEPLFRREDLVPEPDTAPSSQPDVRPDFVALRTEVLELVPEAARAEAAQSFDHWAAARSLVPTLAGVEVIVGGQPHAMVVREAESYRDLRLRALAETQHDSPPYPPATEWELRDGAGRPIDLDLPARILADGGWHRLWLSLRAGAGS